MRQLTEADVLRTMREEWEAKKQALVEEIDLTLVAPELKVKHGKSGLRYTVDSVSTRDVILRTPEGSKMLVDKAHFEREYELA